jgi:hypothetical protein
MFSFSIVSFIAIDIAQSAGDNLASTQLFDTVLYRYYLGPDTHKHPPRLDWTVYMGWDMEIAERGKL